MISSQLGDEEVAKLIVGAVETSEISGSVAVCRIVSVPAPAARAGKTKLEHHMTVRIQNRPTRTNWPADILFLALTLAPWVVLAGLLLSPRR
jgi:hypothetical protein